MQDLVRSVLAQSDSDRFQFHTQSGSSVASSPFTARFFLLDPPEGGITEDKKCFAVMRSLLYQTQISRGTSSTASAADFFILSLKVDV